MNFEVQEEFYLVSSMRKLVDGKLNWQELFCCIGKRQSSQPHHPEEIEKMREILLDALLTHGCDDEDIVHRFFEFYARYLSQVWCWRRFSHDNYSLGTLWTRLKLTGTNIHWVLEPMKGGCFVNLTEMRGRWKALQARDWKFLRVLVRYGHWKETADSDENVWGNDFAELWMYIHQHIVPVREISPADLQLKWAGVLRELKEDHYRTPTYNRRQFIRIYLIVRTLKAVVLYREENPTAELYMKCLELYFTAVPDPMVSADEVRKFLLSLLREEVHRPVVDSLVEAWADLFGRQPYTPRTLKYLCCCSVRKILLKRNSGTLPSLVEQLCIPSTLRDFLLGAPESKPW